LPSPPKLFAAVRISCVSETGRSVLRINEHRKWTGHHFAQNLQPLDAEPDSQADDASDIAPRPIEAGDQATDRNTPISGFST
jgi:hypothetical protein